MARNRYDQASRYGAKMDPPVFLAWLLRVPALPLPFRACLDTRALHLGRWEPRRRPRS